MSKSRKNTIKRVFKTSKIVEIKPPYKYRVKNSNYIIVTKTEAHALARTYIYNMLYTFDPEILEMYSLLQSKTIKFIQTMYPMTIANEQLYNTLTDFYELSETMIKDISLATLLSSDNKELNNGRYKIFKS